MRFKKYGVIVLAIVMILTIGLAGCEDPEDLDDPTEINDENDDPVDENDEPTEGGTVTRGIWSSPAGTFHPQLYTDAYDAMTIDIVFDGLLSYDPFEEEYVPNLAEDFEMSDDNLTMKFTLRDDIYWHDGEPFTMDDVVHSYEFVADPDYTGVRFPNIQRIEGVEAYRDGEADEISGINVINDRELEITLQEVYAPALGDVGAFMLSPAHIWEDVDVGGAAERNDLLENPIGTGPFKMEEFARDEYVRLVKNEDYHRGSPLLDGITLEVTGQDTAQARLATGDLDFMDVSEMSQDQVAFFEDQGIVVEEVITDGYQHMIMNNRIEPFDDVNVRQGVAYTLDRAGFVEYILEGFGEVAHAPLAPFSWAYPDMTDLNTYGDGEDDDREEATENAIAKFEEAGWSYEDGTMYDENGDPVEFTLKYPTGNVPREESALIWQENFSEVGIDVELRSMDFDTLASNYVDERDFELALMGWSLVPDPNPYGIWHSDQDFPGGFNQPGFVDERNDELIEEGIRYIEEEERQPIYQEWGELMNEKVPGLPLYHMIEGRAYRPEFQGHQFHPFTDYHNVHEWYLDE
ncbi:ABC transporter substrate-binding protein [Isachenkonia alkalipeptolytica]|nr:ABC transporter substrate-binding protein [Isachenkonia alkalipeptolytica]